MGRGGDIDVDRSAADAIRSAFRERYVPLALRGLPRMLVDGGRWFSFRAFPGEEPNALRNEGRSERYSAMALIGLERQRALGRADDVPTDPVVESLATWAPEAPNLGDAALVLWVLALRGDARAEPLAARIVARQAELDRPEFGFASMDMGCLLTGLAEALRLGLTVDGQQALATSVAERLALQQDRRSQLFSFARKVRRKNLHRVRLDTRLGSFASQVYPTLGMAALARATGDERAATIARRCARAICELQGEQGQWWWIYHVARGHAAIRYPVYSVHQDAMGPMMLTAAALADGHDPRYDEAILASLRWLEVREELPAAPLVDEVRGVVWRAIQHDEPATTRRLGLSPVELKRMGWAAWIGAPDDRVPQPGQVCGECRSYHLGWILLADAMYAELAASGG